MQLVLAQIADGDVVVNIDIQLLRCGHAQHVNKLLSRGQPRPPVGLLEVLERSVIPNHRFSDLDPPLAGTLLLAGALIVVAVLSGYGAVMLFGEIFRLFDLNNVLIVENFAPGSGQALANRAENPHHRHVEVLRYALG